MCVKLGLLENSIYDIMYVISGMIDNGICSSRENHETEEEYKLEYVEKNEENLNILGIEISKNNINCMKGWLECNKIEGEYIKVVNKVKNTLKELEEVITNEEQKSKLKEGEKSIKKGILNEESIYIKSAPKARA